MRRWRRAALIGTSAVLHAALLLSISQVPARLRLPPELGGPVTTVEIVRLRPRSLPATRVAGPSSQRAAAIPARRVPITSAAESETLAPSLLAGAMEPQVAPSCAPEVLLLLTPEERSECARRRAAAAAMANRGFKPAEPGEGFSTVRPEVAQGFAAEAARKAAGRDIDAGQAELKQFWADGPARTAPAWAAGDGGSGVAVQARCTVRFSGWKIEDRPPECRFGASTR